MVVLIVILVACVILLCIVSTIICLKKRKKTLAVISLVVLLPALVFEVLLVYHNFFEYGVADSSYNDISEQYHDIQDTQKLIDETLRILDSYDYFASDYQSLADEVSYKAEHMSLTPIPRADDYENAVKLCLSAKNNVRRFNNQKDIIAKAHIYYNSRDIEGLKKINKQLSQTKSIINELELHKEALDRTQRLYNLSMSR